MTETFFQDAIETGRLIQQGEITSVEITQSQLERIESLSRLKAFVTTTADLALEQAAIADQQIQNGEVRSPLHGVPIAVKDLLATEGIATSNGMSIYAEDVPGYNASVVNRLAGAGTVMLGKLKLTEGAFSRHHPEVEIPLNPWDENLWTGSSSSGSGVATAAGLCFGSLGTDTGGSIRFPSAANGIVGLKPTWGRVSRFGAFPLAYSLDHIGPMTRSVADAAAMLQVIAGYDPGDLTSSRLEVPEYPLQPPSDLLGLTIGLDESYVSLNTDEGQVESVRQALNLLEQAGASVESVDISYKQVCEAWVITTGVETSHAHRETYPARKDEYGATGGLIEVGLSAGAAAYMAAEMARREFVAELAGIFQKCDILICPSMPLYRPPREGSIEMDEAETDLVQTLKFTAPFNYSGSPTLSLPWFLDDGVPASVQLIADQFREQKLIEVGLFLESARGAMRNPVVTPSGEQ